MRQETIQRVFPSSDWLPAECDQCCEMELVVLIEDQRACWNCLEKFYDENGDKVVLDSDLAYVGNRYGGGR